MTIYIRDEKNNTLVDIELYKYKKEGYVDISSSVCIDEYSKFLLSIYDDKSNSNSYVHKVIDDFDFLSELRGWLWDYYFMKKKNTDKEYDNVLRELMEVVNNIATKYNLAVVTD